MKKYQGILGLLLLVCMLCIPSTKVLATNTGEIVPPVEEPEKPTKEEWVKEEKGIRYYYKDGTYATGAKVNIEDKFYSFDQDGYRTSGWIKIDKNWFFFDKENENAMLSNQWLKDDGKWYMLSEDGTMLKEKWYQENGIWYFLHGNGKMAANEWLKRGQTWYYLRSSGAMIENDWLKYKNVWYYLKNGGAMSTNEWVSHGQSWYFIEKSGIMASNKWAKWNNYWYFLKPGGVMASSEWVKWNGYWYYQNPNGTMCRGWIKLKNVWYYLKDSGIMASNESLTIKGVNYRFDASGRWIEKNKKLIAIDAGHQRTQNKGKEPVGPGSSQMKQKVSSGTQGVATGLNEYELNLTVSLKLQKELEKRGYDVYMIRTTHDVDISNAKRAQNAAAAGSDILIRIHANSVDSSSVHGALTMAPKNDNPFLSSTLIKQSLTLSQKIVDEFVKATGAKNMGVQTYNNMTGINWSTIPVTIVEMGFMSNANEDRLMATDSYQNKMVTGIANGVDAYYR